MMTNGKLRLKPWNRYVDREFSKMELCEYLSMVAEDDQAISSRRWAQKEPISQVFDSNLVFAWNSKGLIGLGITGRCSEVLQEMDSVAHKAALGRKGNATEKTVMIEDVRLENLFCAGVLSRIWRFWRLTTALVGYEQVRRGVWRSPID